jgi:uncharacterized protein (TIGR02217 family)
MAGFHEVQFPMRLALGTSGGPVRRTDIVSLSNGRENRNQRWRDARRRYDAGSGIRSISDLYEVLSFFEARSGELYGFRFTDPIDYKSCGPDQSISRSDQRIGTGDGTTRSFQLVKVYRDAGGSSERQITKPQEGSVAIEIDGEPVAGSAYTVGWETGIVRFDDAPGDGSVIRAGFRFDVPVRFDVDRLEINLDAFAAGRIPTIPLVEIAP